MNHCWSVVPSIFALAIGIAKNRGTQYIVWVGVGLTHTLIDHIREAHIPLPLHVHADPDKHRDNAGVLADRTVTHGAHARIDQNLSHGVFRCLGLFAVIGLFYRLNKIHRMIVGNILQRVGNAVDKVLLANNSHADFNPCYLLAGGSHSIWRWS